MKRTISPLGIAILFGFVGCAGDAGSVEPDTSVTNSSFCNDYKARCPGTGAEFIAETCSTRCSSGVKPTTKTNPSSLCWKVYCAMELKDCTSAGDIPARPSALECATAHGWLLD